MMKRLIRRIEKCNSDITNLELKVLSLNFLFLAIIILTSAAASLHEDSWNIREGIYAWFITFTTVGFGDFVPKKMIAEGQPNGLIISGLCFMSGVVDAMVEYVYKGDDKVPCCSGAGFCSKSTTRSANSENEIETGDTQNQSLSNLGFEEAATQNRAITSSQDTML